MICSLQWTRFLGVDGSRTYAQPSLPSRLSLLQSYMSNTQTEAKASTNDKVTLRVASTFGNFDYVAETQVSRDIIETAANKGFLWELQRSPAGAAEFAITGFDGKTKVKPDKWTRTNIPFTPANAEVIRKSLADRENFAKGSFLPSNAKIAVTVTEHVPTQAEPKFTQERNYCKMTIQFEGIESLKRTAKKAGYKGSMPVDSEDNFELFACIAEYRKQTIKSL